MLVFGQCARNPERSLFENSLASLVLYIIAGKIEILSVPVLSTG
jgi:hypothetical protein